MDASLILDEPQESNSPDKPTKNDQIYVQKEGWLYSDSYIKKSIAIYIHSAVGGLIVNGIIILLMITIVGPLMVKMIGSIGTTGQVGEILEVYKEAFSALE